LLTREKLPKLSLSIEQEGSSYRRVWPIFASASGFRILAKWEKGLPILLSRENSEILAFNERFGVRFASVQSQKSPEKREIHAKSESNSLSCRLTSGGCSHQRTGLCPKFPLTGKNTGKLMLLLIPKTFNTSILLGV